MLARTVGFERPAVLATRIPAAGAHAVPAMARPPANIAIVLGGRRRSSSGPRSGSPAAEAGFSLSAIAGVASNPVQSTGSIATRRMRAIERAGKVIVRNAPIDEPPFGKTSKARVAYAA